MRSRAFFGLFFGCALMLLACGDQTHVGNWVLVEVENANVPGFKPAGYDAALFITTTEATIREDFGGECIVTMVGVPYKEKDGVFTIPTANVATVECRPNPCDAILQPESAILGTCPAAFPLTALPDFTFEVEDADNLSVDIPYFRNVFEGVRFTRLKAE